MGSSVSEGRDLLVPKHSRVWKRLIITRIFPKKLLKLEYTETVDQSDGGIAYRICVCESQHDEVTMLTRRDTRYKCSGAKRCVRVCERESPLDLPIYTNGSSSNQQATTENSPSHVCRIVPACLLLCTHSQRNLPVYLPILSLVLGKERPARDWRLVGHCLFGHSFRRALRCCRRKVRVTPRYVNF